MIASEEFFIPGLSRFREIRSRITNFAEAKIQRGVARNHGATHRGGMKTLELSDETYAALQRLAAANKVAPSDILMALLDAARHTDGDPLLFFLTGAEYNVLADTIERYLALLAWVAKHFPSDFADFISHQDSARRYLMLNREEVSDIRARNLARQIDGTQFWAVMTIDDATRRRFVRRLLEFVGCHDETVMQAVRSLEIPSATTAIRRAS
jgi:negative modulator of initiation of replication